MRAVLFYRCWIGPKYEARGCLLRSCFFFIVTKSVATKTLPNINQMWSACLFCLPLLISPHFLSIYLVLPFTIFRPLSLSLLNFHCIRQCATVYWAYMLSLIHTHLWDKHKHSLQCFSFGFIAQNLFALHWRGIVITYR